MKSSLNIKTTDKSKERQLYAGEILLLTLIYIITARIGQSLGIPPGNVTPVWIPSGIILAALIIRGVRLWPGIWLGAFLGNIWAYMDFTSFSNGSRALFSGFMNGTGDVLGTITALWLLKRTTGDSKSLLNSIKGILHFILWGALLSSLISALFGVTSLTISGFVPRSSYLRVLKTWFIGDAVGVLIITPVLFALKWPCSGLNRRRKPMEIIIFLIILLSILFICLNPWNILPPGMGLPLFLIIPLFLWPVFRFRQRTLYHLVLLTSLFTVGATAGSYGPFIRKDLNSALIELQLYLAVISVTVLVLRATLTEHNRIDRELVKYKAELEKQLEKKTAQVFQSNEQIFQEIKKQEETEKNLINKESNLQAILHSIGDAVIATDTKGHIIMINPVACRLTGWSESEACGKTLRDIFCICSSESGEKIPDPDTRILSTGKLYNSRSKVKLISRDNREYIISDTITPIIDRERNIAGTVLVFRDMTEQYKNEEELFKSRKLKTIGILAGGIAHDFNNILTGLFGYIELAKSHIPKDHSSYSYMETANKALDKAKSLTAQLLTFSRGGNPVIKTMHVAEIIPEAVRFNLSGSNIKVTMNLPKNLWNIQADKGQISQVIANLTINAKQAMPEGGTLNISARNIPGESKYREMDRVEIQFKDEGPGIAEENLSLIFDPYFTTKDKGIGLGLATVNNIIHKHNGTIKALNTREGGALFIITLPADITAEDNLPEEHSEATEENTKNPWNILIMDDEELIRTMASEMLLGAGYRPDSAASGEEAIHKYTEAQKRGIPYDLVIMDLTIPGGMGGRDAMNRLWTLDPGVKVIVSSGYSTDPILANYRDYGFAGRLEKPFQLKELLKVVENTLTERDRE